MPEHYLDNAATTPIDPAVVDYLASTLGSCYGNPSSLHPLGIAAARELEVARDLMLGMLGAQRIVFTGGGTEATNLAMRGCLGSKRGRIVVGAADHPSVHKTAKSLAALGHEVATYPLDGEGRPELEAFEELLDDSVLLVSLLHGNNENGVLLPLAEMIGAIREKSPRAHVHVDGVQAFCKVPLDVDRDDIDSLTLAAHKVHGPKGIGALALGHRAKLKTQITGGGQEGDLRSGTENVCGNRAFAMAAENWLSRMDEESGRVQSYRDRAERELSERIDGFEPIGSREHRLPHILCVGIRGVRGEVVMHHLAEAGVYISTGSACSSSQRAKAKSGSHVLDAMNVPKDIAQGALRISFGRLNDEGDVDALVEALPGIINKLRELGA